MNITSSITKSILVLMAITLTYPLNSFAEHKKVKKGNTIIYKNNVFVLAPEERDSTNVKGSKVDSIVVTLNGQKILTDKEIDGGPTGDETINSLLTTLIEKNSPSFAKLGDGDYTIDISQVVIGSNGRLLYYKFEGALPLAKGKNINKSAQSTVNKLIDDLLASDEILFGAGNKDGLRVTCISKTMDTHIQLKVNKGVTTILN